MYDEKGLSKKAARECQKIIYDAGHKIPTLDELDKITTKQLDADIKVRDGKRQCRILRKGV